MSAIPPEAQTLGAPIAEYRPTIEGRANAISALVLLPLSCICVGAGVVIGERGALVTLALVGAGLFALAIWLLYGSIRSRDLRVWLFADGIAYREAGTTRVFRWEEIGWVWQEITKVYQKRTLVRSTHRYTLQTLGGEKLKINPAIEGIAELGERIQQELFHRQLPGTLEAFGRGTPLVFGPLTISREGLSDGEKRLLWNEVATVRLESGVVSIYAKEHKGAWRRVNVGEIPNLRLFLELVNRVGALSGA